MNKGIWVAVAAMLVLPAVGAAQQKGNIELKAVSEIEVVTKNAKGEQEVTRVDAATAKVSPGDIVIMTITYRNVGKKPAGNAVITNPVPEHTAYVNKSAEGKDTVIDFSVDKGKTFAAPDKLKVSDTRGGMRQATPADYTDIRWKLGKQLAPGETGSVSFRARIK